MIDNKNDIYSFLKQYRYLITVLLFLIWMLFFDSNSFLQHRRYDNEISSMEERKEFLKKEIERDKKKLHNLQNSREIEKFARERYFMKKKTKIFYIIKKIEK